jgi:hypothetical protein
MMLVLIAALGATAGLFAFYRTDKISADNERVTSEALAAAKAALIGYALARGGATGVARPGELPCPDTDAPGTAGYGLENAPCSTNASLLGRIPWKTLGIPEPKDSAGETLWYALSGNFRDAVSNPATHASGVPAPAERINSDTQGTITVRAADGSTVLTSAAVAVVFSPGAPHGNQNRAAASAATASNYLDSTAGTNNAASATGPFIAGTPTATFNDRLAYIDTSEFIPAVEMRVANELKSLLLAYRVKSNCQCYPWADNWPYSGGIADISQNRGRIPTEAYPENWGDGNIPPLPQWVGANNWHNLFWYSVSRTASADPVNCRTCSASQTLSVGSTKVAALFFAPGSPLDGQARVPPLQFGASLSSAQRARADNLSLYLQDAQNNDGANSSCPDTGEIGGDPGWGAINGAASCDQYVEPSSTARNRDRLYMLGAATAATCTSNAQALVAAAPCGTGWTVTNPVCQAAVPNLDACSCATAARVIAQPPCNNVIAGEPQCQAAVALLQTCTLLP